MMKTLLAFLLMTNVAYAATIGDIDNDGKVGLAETIYSLQVTAGLNPNLGNQPYTNSTGMTFNYIPAGTFIMGSPSTENGRSSGEIQHVVTLTKPFLMQITEVTQAQWMNVIGFNIAGYANGGNYPVENMNWYEAAYFANALTALESSLTPCYDLGTCTGMVGGLSPRFECPSIALVENCTGYQLPTEAQWEYAARAGTVTAFYSGDITNSDSTCDADSNLDSIGWYCGNTGDATSFQPVGGKEPNDWGLYDMSGNVSEWCFDYMKSGSDGYYISPEARTDPTGPSLADSDMGYRVTRGGGSFEYLYPKYARSASRSSANPKYPNPTIGFRLILAVPSE